VCSSDLNPLPAYQGRDYIGVATEKAINYLDQKNDNGFFLMVEGSQIDWGGHANNSDYIISEVIDFDKAVKAALDFAEKDGNTLVVITADHETGGYAINKGSTMDSLVTAFTTDYHTADLIPVFAFGPKAADFGGIYENTAIFDKMMKALFH
jgi:alkaline phosphatase